MTRLPHIESTSDAHVDASATMLREADLLFAVWDGQPARGYGGTADIVAEAGRQDVAVTRIWPTGGPVPFRPVPGRPPMLGQARS